MKVTVNGITFEGSEDEVKRMIEWQEKRMTTPTCGGGSSAGESPKAPYEVSCDSATSSSSAMEKKTCPRGHSSKCGCEYFLFGECRAVCYPTNPPQYDKCVFCGSDSNMAM